MATQHSKDPDLEKQPLLTETIAGPDVDKLSKKQRLKNLGTTSFGSTAFSDLNMPTTNQEDKDWNCSQYETGVVNSWKILFVITGSAFDNVVILKTMMLSILVSMAVACCAYYKEEVLLIKGDKVVELATFLNVFVGMLLGFFVSSSMHRWHGCVQGFMELLSAVRNMHMQMVALGVDREHFDMLNRYGLLSVWLIHLSLNSECRNNPRSQDLGLSEAEQREKVWSSLEEFRPHLALPAEKELLFQYHDCYALLWTWIASLIGRMAQDGEIPPMASPTYGRIISIVEMAYGSIRDVRMMHQVKAPFIYAHTLAVLVHVNTILNSLSFGLILGTTLQVAFGTENVKLQKDLPRFVSSLFMQLCFSMVAPWMYLTLLEVCVCISQPFIFMDTKIPTLHLIIDLEEELARASVMSDNTKWEKPRFKK